MLLFFARHGKTDYNARDLCQGQLDIPLNDEGKHQATRLGEVCKDICFTAIYSSDLSRAKETAERIAAHHAPLTVQVVPALKEQYWGSAQGLRLDPGDPLPVDMETQEHLETRVHGWINGLIQSECPVSKQEVKGGSLQPDSDGKVVMIVTHEDCLLSLRHLILNATDGCALSEMELAPKVRITDQVADVTCVVVRIWNAGNGVKGRIEAWGWSGDAP